MYWCSSAASARADSRSCPNGFSTTTRAFFVSPASCEPLDDPAEQERRDLEVEDGLLGVRDRLGDALVRRRVAEVARDVGEAVGQPLEDVLVERLAGADDRLPCALDELVDGPVVDRHADDRAVEQPAPLEPVQRPERHHLRQVACDPEDHEDIGRLLSAGPIRACLRAGRVCRSCCHAALPTSVAEITESRTDVKYPAARAGLHPRG